MLHALIILLALGQTPSEKAKAAFADVKSCQCTVCTCDDCKCANGVCACNGCGLTALYAKSIQDDQVIVLEVGGVQSVNITQWRVVKLKSLPGEQPGYIIGVPKNGKLVRLDFTPNTPRDRMRLNVLHVIYPLTAGYSECPTCPQGRIWVGVTSSR